jgi:hypothetical protein
VPVLLQRSGVHAFTVDVAELLAALAAQQEVVVVAAIADAARQQGEVTLTILYPWVRWRVTFSIVIGLDYQQSPVGSGSARCSCRGTRWQVWVEESLIWVMRAERRRPAGGRISNT